MRPDLIRQLVPVWKNADLLQQGIDVERFVPVPIVPPQIDN